MKPAPPAGGMLPALDGLRGAAALSVFVFHFLCSVPYCGLSVPPRLLAVSTHFAVLAVHVFFAASGFILVCSLERAGDGRRTAGGQVALDFYLRRFFRIVPLWWLLLTIELFRQHLSARVYLANATFAFGFLAFDARYLPILVAWTLFVEMSFYAVLPGMFRWIRGIPSALVFTGLAVGLARLWTRQATAWGIPSDHFFISDFPLACFKYFAVGILVRYLHPRVPAKWSPWLDAAAVGSLLVTAFTPRFGTYAVFLLLLAVLAPESRLGRWFAVRPLAFAGVHCYFIYLAHNQLFIDPMLQLFSRLSFNPASPGSLTPVAAVPAFVLALALCMVAAAVSMRFFERPMIGLGRRIGSRLMRSGRALADAGAAGRAA